MIQMLGFAIHAALAAAVVAQPAVTDRARYLMGTVCRIAAAHPEPGRAAALAEEAFAEIARWEAILSDYDPESELSRLNASAASGPFACSPELFAFLAEGASLAASTSGSFDPTVGALVDLYDVRGAGRWPPAGEVAAALGRTGYRRLEIDPSTRTARFLSQGMRLDPGAMGKGFALDAAAAILRAGGVEWALLDFGGQVLAVGAGPDGCGFPVEVASSGRSIPSRLEIRLRDASAATSANDERGRTPEGKPLGHIFDPRTGEPARGVVSVTVVAPTATLADALSTALFVLGPGEGPALAERAGVKALYTVEESGVLRAHPTPGFGRYFIKQCAGGAPASPALEPR